MIVYRELSSLCADLGCSLKHLYTLSNRPEKHYHKVSVPKNSGGFRELTVPDNELKTVQKRIDNVILPIIEISPYATAYRPGGSPLANAKPHINNNTLLKLDIRHFFDKITFSMILGAFSKEIFSDKVAMILAQICSFHEALPQGAPTSPAISNIIMKDFDNAVGAWCKNGGITYTRYCDDMTFSGSFKPNEVIEFVKSELAKYGFYLNNKKTTVVRDGLKKIVTGIVINEKANTSAIYRRKVRQTMYYCMKYGIDSHIQKKNITDTKEHYLQKLLGQINFVLSVTPENEEFIKYKRWVTENLQMSV